MGGPAPRFLARRAGVLVLVLASLLAVAVATPAGAAPQRARQVPGATEGDPLAPLVLLNGWVPTNFGTAAPAAGIIDGAVVFRGAAMSGSSDLIATLPAGMRPAKSVWIPITLCNAVPGRLLVNLAGQISVFSSEVFADAQCFTSLDGASFTLGPATRLTLRNGWVNDDTGTRPAKARVQNGTVRLSGAIAGGTRPTAFILPEGMRPHRPTYVTLDLCTGIAGRLLVLPNGKAKVESSTDFSAAQCFTSLEGATFRLGAPVPLSLTNGWTDGVFGARPAKIATFSSTRQLVGAVGGGSDELVASVPELFRPITRKYVRTNLCNAEPGRLIIETDGDLIVDPTGDLGDAQCFTSLDGVTFAN